ncbi:MAG: tRNA (guanosine(46)-N7)-methyltransferase TrmB [Tetrasphaera sp.]
MPPASAAREGHPPRPIRSYTPRYRTSALTRSRMERLLPRYGVGHLPIDPQALFDRRAALVLEIGAGHGAAAIAYAAAHPQEDVLVAEVHVPGVVRMLAAAENAAVGNIRVYVGDAVDLLGGLPPASVSRVHLLFPDPWPKRRHQKRRFVQRHTLAAIRRLLVPGGVLLVATDHPVYAAHVLAQFAGCQGFAVGEVRRPEWKPLDGFEAKGLAAGRTPIYLEARSRPDLGAVSGDAGA